MRKKKDNDLKIYSEEELRELIDEIAEKELNISGEKAIEIVRSKKWKNQEYFAAWDLLDSLIILLPDDPRRENMRVAV